MYVHERVAGKRKALGLPCPSESDGLTLNLKDMQHCTERQSHIHVRYKWPSNNKIPGMIGSKRTYY